MGIINELRKLKNIPASENYVAEYILANSKEVLTMNSRMLAMKTYTSPSTVIRLCQRVGADGFPDLKIKLALEVEQYTSSSEEVMEAYEIEQDDSVDAIAKKMMQGDIDAISATYQILDTELIKQAVDMINEAEVVDFYGIGSSALVARDAYYKLLRIGKYVTAHTEADHQEINARLSSNKHVAVIISYTGETKQLLDIARILHIRGTKIISVTGLKDNRLREMSDIDLSVRSKETSFRIASRSSRTAMFYIFDILYAVLINSAYESNMERLAETYIPKENE